MITALFLPETDVCNFYYVLFSMLNSNQLLDDRLKSGKIFLIGYVDPYVSSTYLCSFINYYFTSFL